MKVMLTQGKYALIDDEDFDKISGYKWCFHSIEGYAIATVYGVNPKRRRGQTTYSMHRIIMDAPNGMEVDHRNGNKLDNRKTNLRLCSKKQNLINTGPRADNSSGFKGVSFDKFSGKFKAQANIDGKRVLLGRYATAEHAAAIYNAAVFSEYGAFAYLNPLKEPSKS